MNVLTSWSAYRASHSPSQFEFSRGFDTKYEDGDYDCCFYPLGIRPDVPVVDFYYFQYMLWMLRHDKLKKLIIYPSVDLSAPGQAPADFARLKEKIEKIFEPCLRNVTVLDPSAQENQLATVDLLSKDFLSSLVYLTGDAFRDICRQLLHRRRWSWLQCSRHHPADQRLSSIFVHVAGGHVMWRHLCSQVTSQALPDFGRLRVGILMWETEMAKLAVFYEYSSRDGATNMEFGPILGRTIGKPLPVFEHNKTVTVFADLATTIDLLKRQSPTENRLISHMLDASLRSNYTPRQPTARDLATFKEDLARRQIGTPGDVGSLPGHALKAAWLINHFQRHIYN